MATFTVPSLWALLSFFACHVYSAPSTKQVRQSTGCTEDYFNGIIPSGISIERVEKVTTGTFVESGDIGYPSFAGGLPSLCAVIVKNETANYRFGMFLPDDWNSRFLAIGSYSFLGGINWLDMGPGAKYGMASLSTDTGHSSGQGDLTWPTTQELKVNWAYQALEGSIVLGKTLIESYYSNKPIAYSYFSGCSTGGRQGLKQIQRDPDMFDGALIGAPAWDTKHLMPWISKLATWNLPEDAAGSINDSNLFSRLQAEVVKQCDSLDGVQDNIVSSLSACREHFDISKIRCDVTSNKTSCWTQAQIDTAQKMYTDYTTEDGEFVYKGMDYSSEAGWATYLLPADANDSSNVRRNFDAEYERTFMSYGSGWQITSYNDSVVSDARVRDESIQCTADQYDLGSFRTKGKIVMYGGLADSVVPVQHTNLYYDRTVDAMGNIDDFFRYFQIPGMGHCWGTPDNVKAPWMMGGAGQAAQMPPYNSGFSVPLGNNDTQHDALLALMDWVENGNAVSQIIASEFNFTDATLQNIVMYRQRPICPYPQTAMWDGQGSQDDASSWQCK
ncbi:tannase and feruloyl esterase [Annulohypoxylon truncatum]|uniref:tannase and feruloyl esterase n=1 Tax=Annulohypoxylon truncatum TaxID=327061 RepID=UPI00200791CA|nr:tannase and feruloyl esterase [Annulohypoxylon truncatum]KAI1209040.1 tannase and feruloyl esterase [Annulohypoxylon truncatum]